jgi:D-sedoheptulose 7-phosphate isomerase
MVKPQTPCDTGSPAWKARIASHFDDSVRLKRESAKLLSAPIARAIGLMAAALKAGGKILACGNGGSAG